MGTDSLEERRKKATLKRVERKHAGKVQQPYRILEELIDQYHPDLVDAKFIILWKSGWKPDKDKRLTRAKITKASEAEREIWGDCDYILQLHRELWKCDRYSEENRRHDIDHELCHAAPEIDDASGDQRVDERDRLCWRVRKHPIETFPELIERHGLETCTGIDAQSILDDDKAAAEFEVQAEENDAKRPLLKAAETGEWRRLDVAELGIPPRVATKLHDAGKGTLGDLVDLMRAEESWWHKAVPGVGQEASGKVNDALAKFRKDHPEYEGL